jgi:hypothetical protein
MLNKTGRRTSGEDDMADCVCLFGITKTRLLKCEEKWPREMRMIELNYCQIPQVENKCPLKDDDVHHDHVDWVRLRL